MYKDYSNTQVLIIPAFLMFDITVIPLYYLSDECCTVSHTLLLIVYKNLQDDHTSMLP